MIIETKYDVGQELYHILSFLGTYKVLSRKFSISYSIERRGKINKITYKSYDPGGWGEILIDEERINNIGDYFFTTRELAQAECDRRNQGGD